MKKVIVIGCPGSGKSTFSKRLSRITALPLYHLDMIWHKPDKTTISREEFDNKINKIIRQTSWIIDGNYGRTLENRIKGCDTVFLFDLPTDVCIEGAKSRIGKPRDDMPWVEDIFDPEFKQWILDFPKKELPHVYEMIEKYSHKNIIIFESREQIDKFINNLEKITK